MAIGGAQLFVKSPNDGVTPALTLTDQVWATLNVLFPANGVTQFRDGGGRNWLHEISGCIKLGVGGQWVIQAVPTVTGTDTDFDNGTGSIYVDESAKARVEIAVAKFAMYKLDENPATAGHALAVKWAQNALANPGSVAGGILPAVVMDAAIQAKASDPTTITDDEVQSAVEAAINRVLNS